MQRLRAEEILRGSYSVQVAPGRAPRAPPGAKTASHAVLDLPDVEVVDHRIQDADGIVLGDKVAQTRRKKQIVVLIVRFKYYLCHCLTTDKLFYLYFATTR